MDEHICRFNADPGEATASAGLSAQRVLSMHAAVQNALNLNAISSRD